MPTVHRPPRVKLRTRLYELRFTRAHELAQGMSSTDASRSSGLGFRTSDGSNAVWDLLLVRVHRPRHPFAAIPRYTASSLVGLARAGEGTVVFLIAPLQRWPGIRILACVCNEISDKTTPRVVIPI